LEEIHKSISELGINEETVALTKKTIESTVQLVKRVRTVGDLLTKMRDQGNYIYDHSLKVSYVCTAIARYTEWGSASTAYKLSLAATLHDMTIDDPELAKIQYQNDPTLNNYSEEQKNKYFLHPQESAKMIKDSKEFPPDIDFIVAQHHERPDGSGFPRGLSKLRIAPLSCLFILAHEFVTRVESRGGKYDAKNRDAVFDQLDQEMYTEGNFKKPFMGLCKAFGLKSKYQQKLVWQTKKK